MTMTTVLGVRVSDKSHVFIGRHSIRLLVATTASTVGYCGQHLSGRALNGRPFVCFAQLISIDFNTTANGLQFQYNVWSLFFSHIMLMRFESCIRNLSAVESD